MHPDHEFFVSAIHRRELVEVAFTNDESRHALFLGTYAPIDYGPAEAAPRGDHVYHFFDYEAEVAAEPSALSLAAPRIISIQATNDTFDPGEFVTWEAEWHYPRDWGAYS